MKTVKQMRNITIESLLSCHRTREGVAQSIDCLITSVKCNMLSEELTKRLKEAKDQNKLNRQLNKI